MNATPLEKLHKDAVFLTVFVMFLLISWVIPQLETRAGGQVSSWNLSQWLVPALVTALGSRPTYGVIANLLVSLARSQVWLKRRYLGRGFLHGTWFGILRTKRGHLRIFVEQFDQELDQLTIRGSSFRLPESLPDLEPGRKRKDRFKEQEALFALDATWLTRATDVNPRAGELYCFYENGVIRKHYEVKAVGHFIFDYGQSDVPVELKGYAIDVDAGIERIQEYFSRVSRGQSAVSSLEEIKKVRLSYEKVVKARRTHWVFNMWLVRWFSDRMLTIDEAKAAALSFFWREIEEEVKRSKGNGGPGESESGGSGFVVDVIHRLCCWVRRRALLA